MMNAFQVEPILLFRSIGLQERKKERNALRTLHHKKKRSSRQPLMADSRPDDPFIYDEIWKAKINCGRFRYLH